MIIKIIGLGGIGSIFSDMFCRFLNYSMLKENIELENNINVTLIDGDIYETKNLERQCFSSETVYNNKAETKKLELSHKYKNIKFSSVTEYINDSNIDSLIFDHDIVFAGVDNHKTRKILSTHCERLNDITLISGGNDITNGDVLIYIKKEGKELTPPLTYRPEIANPSDKSPEEMSCEELSKSEPQLFFTNAFAALIMCSVYYSYIYNNQQIIPSTVYFDILKSAVRPSFIKM